MVEIMGIFPGSRAERAGLCTGDILLQINGHEIKDVLDYRFHLASSNIDILVHRGPELLSFNIVTDTYDDIGLEFETPLMDKKHRCENGCIFCFIDQNPAGMRDSIYFKDDDSRLSFIHGNYITLTNLHESDIRRIIDMHISPVNISVHTTNPELRVKMMKNKRAGEVLDYIRMLSDAGTKMRGQIVLCRGVNDKAELERTMRDLVKYYPALDSVSVVPAGLTAYRRGLYPLEPFSSDECVEVLRQVGTFGDECVKKYGERIFYASDEFYLKGNVPVPDFEYWGEFTQLENGVGMLASFKHEFVLAMGTLSDDEKKIQRYVSVATGEAAYELISELIRELSKLVPGFKCEVYKIKNQFFGGAVTVTGLLTGQDLLEQLRGKNLGECLLLSRAMLRADGDLFLCGMTPDALSGSLGVKIEFCENDGGQFLYDLLGI